MTTARLTTDPGFKMAMASVRKRKQQEADMEEGNDANMDTGL